MKKILFLTITVTVLSLSATAQIAAPKFVDGSLSQGGATGVILYNGVPTRVQCLREGYGNILSITTGTALLANPLYRPDTEINESGNGYQFWGDTKYNLDDMMTYSTVYVIVLRINAAKTGFEPYVEPLRGKWLNLPATSPDLTQWVLPPYNPSVQKPIPTLQKGVVGGLVSIQFESTVNTWFIR